MDKKTFQSPRGGGGTRGMPVQLNGRGRGRGQPIQAPTRKDINSAQDERLKSQVRQAEEVVRLKEQEKRTSGLGIDKTSTAVRHSRTNEVEEIPDISKHWVENIGFMPYLPQNNLPPGALVSTEEEVISAMNMDVAHLLRKKYNHFWSQVVHDASLQKFLDTFLRFRRRGYEERQVYEAGHRLTPRSQARDEDELLFKRVFCVLVRMSTHEENSANFMDRKFHADLVYERRLFDIPKLLDIAVIYGSCSPDAVRRMFAGLFESQPKFYEDLQKSTVPLLRQSLAQVRALASRLDLNAASAAAAAAAPTAGSADAASPAAPSTTTPKSAAAAPTKPKGGKAAPLPTGNVATVTAALDAGSAPPSPKTPRDEVFELAAYLLDIASSLSSFLVAFPPGSHALAAVDFVTQDLVPAYEELCRRLLELSADFGLDAASPHTYLTVPAMVAHARRYLLSVANSVLQHAYLGILTNPIGTPFNCDHCVKTLKEDAANSLFSMLESLVVVSPQRKQDGWFLADFEARYNLQMRLDALKYSPFKLDQQRLGRIVRSLGDALGPPAVPGLPSGSATLGPAGAAALLEDMSAPVVSAEQAARIAQVREVFPDVGDGFVAACLDAMGGNAERVINSLLEGSLPAHLAKLDRKMPLPTRTSATAAVTDTAVPQLVRRTALSGRSDVVDREFYKKKADKPDVSDLKSFYSQYSYESEAAYDDEYDDSYDEFAPIGDVGGQTGDEAAAAVTRLAARNPNHAARARAAAEADDEDDEDETETPPRTPSPAPPVAAAASTSAASGKESQPPPGIGRGRGGPRGGGEGAPRGGGGRGGRGRDHRRELHDKKAFSFLQKHF